MDRRQLWLRSVGAEGSRQSPRPEKSSFTSAVYNWLLFSVEQKLDRKKSAIDLCKPRPEKNNISKRLPLPCYSINSV